MALGRWDRACGGERGIFVALASSLERGRIGVERGWRESGGVPLLISCEMWDCGGWVGGGRGVCFLEFLFR